MNMHHPRKYFLILLISLFYRSFVFTVYAQTVTNATLSKDVSRLKQISTEMNQQVLSLLSLIREYNKLIPVGPIDFAKIITPFASVKEADSENSLTLAQVRLNEEFFITEQRENWFKIRLEDGREGWIMENYLQVLTKTPPEIPGREKSQGKEATVLLSQISVNQKAIFEMHETANQLFREINDNYNGLSQESKKPVEADFTGATQAKDKIEKYFVYANRFFEPFEDLTAGTYEKKPEKVVPGDRFKGTVIADFGKSTYKNAGSNSTISRKLGFNALYKVDPSMSIEAGINHQNELIQTPYSNTSVETAISKRFADKLQLNGRLGYDNYNDKDSKTNTFGMLNSGVNVMYSPSRKSSIYGNISYRNKNYDNMADNNYQGVSYTIGTSLIPEDNKTLKIQVLGISQFSERDFLNFNQVSPMINYMVRKDPNRSMNAGIDVDILKFAASNNSSDYQKYKLELLWRVSRSKKILVRNLNFTYKSFPYNDLQDYVRLGYTLQRRKGSAATKSSSSSFSSIVTYVVNREKMTAPDQLDIRWDKSNTGKSGYFNVNIFNRLWNNFAKSDTTSFDNVIDFYSEFGPNIRNISHGNVALTSLRFGLILGGHIFYNFSKVIFVSEQADEDSNPFEDTFFRNGSSLRGGIGLTGGFRIMNGTLELAGSYERSLIMQKQTTIDTTGTIVYGDNLIRKPSSFQFRIDFRLPLYQNWDIHFNLNNYMIRTDATEETSINPIEKKSNLRFSGGLVYRFSL